MRDRRDADRWSPNGEPARRAPQGRDQSMWGARASGTESSAPGLPTPNLPKGGGAIRGVGEKFTMAAATGTCTLSVPIAVSPGRAGFQPSVALTYNSGAGNGPFGIGWSLDLPSITRKTDKKLPEYFDASDSDTFILSGAEDLVPELEELTAGNWTKKVIERDGLRIERFRPRTEGLFARIERRRDASGNVFWVSIDRNNVTSIYGQSASARVADPSNPTRIFSWLLEATYDDKGNVCVYEYKPEDLVNVPYEAHEHTRRNGVGVGAPKYPKKIRYGNTTPVIGNDLTIAALTTGITFCFTLVFDYGEHDASSTTPDDAGAWPCRQDPFSTYKPTFEVRTYRLCRRILMFHAFTELGGTDPVTGTPIPVLVRSTEFDYEEGPSVTYLTSVTQKGFVLNGTSYESTAMPPVELDYERPVINREIRELDASSRSTLPPMIDGRAHQWVDLDGEGLPGLLSEELGAWRYRRNMGGAQFSGPRLLPQRPSTAALADSRQQLMSIEGNGQLELVEFGAPVPGFYTRDADGDTWSGFVPFRAIPVGVDWNDPNLQFIDLNGDGFADILITHGTSLVWFPSRGKEGFGAPITLRIGHDDDKAPVVVFNDGEQSIHLADMSGDGLTDIVRVRNGNICYWPNLGHGRFGAKITMANAPRFARHDEFDSARVRFFDVDGSGTADILYVGVEINLYRNLAGNRWDSGEVVSYSLPTHHLATISVIDLLGTGTGCLTWFTTLPSEGAPRLRYIDLLGSKKPHVLNKVTNGLGLERLIAYAPSTKFYLEDRVAGVKWATRLPFPMQVVERVEVRDYLAGTRLVSTYRYRHGFFDGHEREFRGFGMVEQWDAESFDSDVGAGTFPDALFPEVDGEFLLPPVRTRTWFHTGAWKEHRQLTDTFRSEYYVDSQAADLPETAYTSTSLSIEEEREAVRALKGMVLRQEVYSDDGTSLAPVPYTVSVRCYEVKRLQPRTAGNRHAVFLAHPREELTYHYERVASDPRALHALTLEVDNYGTPLRTASVAYARRTGGLSPEQDTRLITLTEATVIHKAGEVDWYRIGLPETATTYQLQGVDNPSPGPLYSFTEINTATTSATEIPNESTVTGLKKRVLSRQRTYYYANDLSGALSLGVVHSRALLHHQEQLALTAGLISSIYNASSTTVTATMLTSECGYVESPASSGDYWATSARPIYASADFYQPVGLVDPFGNQSSVDYDAYSLLVVEAHSSTTTTALDNVVTVVNDYRVLQPKLLTDPNGNQTELAFDALGMVVKTAVMGKPGAGQGDTISNPTTMFEYDLWAFKNSIAPNYEPVSARMRARTQHGGTPTWQDAYVYTDGSGRELLTKAQAAPHPSTPTTPRWVGTGRTVYDNKGNPIKKYEPYFSGTSDYDSEAAIVSTGVTPILRYDPLGRLIRTDFPDGTYSKVVFNAWQQESWDQNDTVLDSAWYVTYSGGTTEQQRAASLAAAHANTKTTTKFDVLGRAVHVLQHNGFTASPPTAVEYLTKTQLDIVGNALKVTDARNNVPLEQVYDLLARPIKTISAEAGQSRMLPDLAGTPVRSWNSRDIVMRMTFDAVRRPTHVYAKIGAATETLVLRTIYGEELGSPASADDNLRGQVYRNYDSVGAETFSKRDLKGNLLEQKRVLTVAYTTTPDWSSIASLTSISSIESTAATLLQTAEVFTTSTTYDALNRVVTSTAPDTSSVTTPTYNEANQLVAVDVNVRGASPATAFVTSVKYNARGQREEIVYSNNTKTTYTYDAKTFRLTRLFTERTTDSADLQDLRYTYDPVGNIVETKDLAQQTVYFSNTVVSPDSKYEYDPLYRLTKAEGREHPAHSGARTSAAEYGTESAIPHPNDLQVLRRYTEEYEYDSVGNILELVHSTTGSAPNGWTRWYQYATASNKLTGTSDNDDTQDVPYDDSTSYGDAYTHDARGNMTSMPHLTSMTWDYGDRLQQCALGGGGNSYFNYDAGGNRVRKVWVKTASLIEERIYVGGYEVWREKISGSLDDEKQTLHVMDDQRRIAMVETKTVDAGSTVTSPTSYRRFQLDDHLGSSRVECDHTGALLTYEEYHPYGTTAFRASSGAAGFAPKRYRYTGKERDEETGLYYYGARYYPPWLARWTAVDPAGMVDGPNVYEYVRGNPIGLNDPEGTQAKDPIVQPAAPTVEEAKLADKTDPGIWGPRRKFEQMATEKPGPDITAERDPSRPTGEFRIADVGTGKMTIAEADLDESIRRTYKRITGQEISAEAFANIKGKIIAEQSDLTFRYFNVGNVDAPAGEAYVKDKFPDPSGNPQEHKFAYFRTLDEGVEGYLRQLHGNKALWSAAHYGTPTEFAGVLQSTGYHELPFRRHMLPSGKEHPGALATILGGIGRAKASIVPTVSLQPPTPIKGTVTTPAGKQEVEIKPLPGVEFKINAPGKPPVLKSDKPRLPWDLSAF